MKVFSSFTCFSSCVFAAYIVQAVSIRARSTLIFASMCMSVLSFCQLMLKNSCVNCTVWKLVWKDFGIK